MGLRQIENQLWTLEKKFNLLSAWLQLKFRNDPTFPLLLVTEAVEFAETAFNTINSELAVNEEYEFENDVDLGIEFVSTEDSEDEESRLCDISTNSSQSKNKVKLSPCFINLVRLNPDKVSGRCSSFSENSNNPEHLGETDESDPWSFISSRTIKHSPDKNETTQAHSDEIVSTPFRFRSKQNQSKTKHIQHKSQKEEDGKSSICCPFCHHQCSLTDITEHISKCHQDQMKSDKFHIFTAALRVIKQRVKGKLLSNKKNQAKQLKSKTTLYTCPVCHKQFPEFFKHQAHLCTCHPKVYEEKVKSGEFPPTYRVKCHICYKLLPRSKLEGHIQTMHQDPLLCAECGYKTTTKMYMDAHMKKHAIPEEPKFKCKLCSFEAKEFQGLEDHRKRLHDTANISKQMLTLWAGLKTATG